jgi:hypothetical protein
MIVISSRIDMAHAPFSIGVVKLIMKSKTLLILSILTLMIIYCKKDENKLVKFGWAKDGNRLFFDFYGNTDTIKDFRTLYVSGRFLEGAPTTPNNYPVLFYIWDKDFVIKKGGLYGATCADRNCWCWTLNLQFLYAPNKPYLNQELPEYNCGTVYDTNKIVTIDTIVTVPMGTFRTYVMQHGNGDKSYWNADEGIIMYYVSRGRWKGTLRLNRIVR